MRKIRGGKLMIGIDDKGKPIGLKNAKKLLEDVPNKIRDVLGIIPKVITENKKGKDTLIIEVKPSYAPISYHGKFFVRSGSTIQELKGKELTKYLIAKSDRDWDEYAEEKGSIDDIDIETVLRFKEIAIKRLPFVKEENASSIMKCNTWESRKGNAILSVYGKRIQSVKLRRKRRDNINESGREEGKRNSPCVGQGQEYNIEGNEQKLIA